MRYAPLLVLVLALGCGASTPVVQYRPIPEKQYVEAKELPEAPDSNPISKEGDWVKPLSAGQCTDKDGVLLSPEKAARAALYKDGYKNLRSLYEIDRQIWSQHRIIYDERLSQANKEIERLSPSWWDENKGTVAWASGFLMGAAATVAIVYAVEEVQK